jgi:hypothetical protein
MHLLAALLTLTANVNRDTKKKPQPFTVDDFMPNPYLPSKAEREARFSRIMAEYKKARPVRKAGK